MHRDGPRSGAMSFLFSVLLGLALASACWAQDNAGPNAGQEQAGKAVGGPVASPIAACNEASASALDAGFGLRCGTSIPAGIFLGSYLAATIDSIGDCVKRCVGNESCTAFSLSAHEASLGAEKPSAPLCTLYGSAERFIDEANSVAGVRVSGAVDDSGGSGGGGRHHYHAHRRASAPRKGSKSASQPGSDDAKVELTPDMTALQPVYFATDRVPATGAPLEASFTAGRASKISYGLSVVSIPKNHTVGNVERPKFSYLKWRYQAETDADHFRIKALTPLDHDALVSELAGGDDSVLLFVHGYNVTFADAIYKAAQIAYDANFPGSVLAFSWPSAGALLKYDEDRESAEFAAPDLGQILQMLSAEIGDKKVYIVAHSMGNQVLVGALQQAALSKTDLTINELVMAAPDVDKDVFSRKAEQIRSVAKNVTVYASAADKALLASGEKSYGTRLGFVGPSGPNIFPGIEVIDVTAVGDDMLGLDHGTFASSSAVLADLGRLIRSVSHLEPDIRTPTLALMPDKAHLKYWRYP
jgi:esterase/lipase superfamily enzyme